MVSNWFLYIGIFLVVSGILWPVGAVFIFIWGISFIGKTLKEKNEPEVVNNYVYEGDRVINIEEKQSRKRFTFDDGKLEDWR